MINRTSQPNLANLSEELETEYQQTLEWLYDLHLFGIKLGLKKIKKLLEYLGNPQKCLKIIHVGGTNGKGSVCSILGSILRSAGYRVGINTSPHLSEFTERITINDEQISKEKVVEYGKLMSDLRERINSETDLGYVTYFEVVTAMALKYFADSAVDFVVLEVGLGGTYDATNVVDPLLCVITDVSLDHTEHLGPTLTSVAENKAGIIKNGVPVITSNKNNEVLDVIMKTCTEKKSKCFRLNRDYSFEIMKSTYEGLTINYKGLFDSYTNLRIPLIGEFQGINTSTAIAALEVLQKMEKLKISEHDLRSGLENTKWPGRLEVVKKNPYIILDGAHNPAGAKSLNEALKLFNYKKLYLIFGCSEEKDIGSLLIDLASSANKIILTQANIRRAADPKKIIEAIKQLNLENNKPIIETIVPVTDAVNYVLAEVKKDDLVCICGSLFIVGEAREFLLNTNKSKIQTEHRIHY